LKTSLEQRPVACSARASGPEGSGGALAGTLAEIYHAHFHFVWRNAGRLGVPEASLDDVVQDVFIVVHRRLADYDGRVPLRAWIFGILVRVVRGHRRTFQRKSARLVPLSQERVVATDPTPSDLAERSERVEVLHMLLSQLDENKATLIVLSELEQWTLREIAELMGSNTNTIYSRLCAAKRDFDKAYARWLADAGEHREQEPER
jgi:RNA polymerase sigma-70 factor (ECF subfamily)